MRIGAVSYLNKKPLVYGLAELAPQHELVFDLPSRLADDLAAGRLDVALIPSIEFFQDPAYVIVSDACIGCRGPVLSVKLLSRVAPDKIRTLALDEGSRTSVALTRGMIAVAVVSAAVVGARFVWLFTTPYLIRVLDRADHDEPAGIGSLVGCTCVASDERGAARAISARGASTRNACASPPGAAMLPARLGSRRS